MITNSMPQEYIAASVLSTSFLTLRRNQRTITLDMKTPKRKKNPHAVALGRNGGKARAGALTAERRSQIARDAINARWNRQRAAKALQKTRSRRKKAA